MVESTENTRSYAGDKGLVNLELNRNTPIEKKIVAEHSYGKRIRIAKLFESHEPYMDHIIQICGWARRAKAMNKDVFSIHIHDGSTAEEVQCVIDSTMPNFQDIITCKVGSSFRMRGKLVKSPTAGQDFDLQICHPEKHSVQIYGKCDPTTFPLAGKDHSVEYLREIAHMRPRTKYIAAMTRVRNNLACATHKFFQDRGFQYIHTPLITASDCEGAGEMFQVTTLLPDPSKPVVDNLPMISYKGQEEAEAAAAEALKNPVKKPKAAKAKAQIVPNPDATPEDLAACKAAQANMIAIKKDKSRKEETAGAVAEYDRLRALCEIKIEPKEEEEVKVVEKEKEMIPINERKINYGKDFFGKAAYLTVSGQLAVENYNCAMGDVYTFGPTFRAENSNTSRHLAEFWMIEPEIAFAGINENMDLAEDYLQYCLKYVLQNNKADIEFFTDLEQKEKEKDKKKSKDRVFDTVLRERLEKVANTAFKRITYTECIEILEEHMKGKKVQFRETPKWGCDMGSEHERYLAEKVFNMPIIVYNYPKDFKAFYMKANSDGKTCQAMDILVPGIGELMGGSVREEDLDRLDAAIKEKGLELEPYWWYRELRKYGTQPHAGFGLGFERLVMMCTGIENIRDVIPFPRVPGHAEF